MIVILFLLKKKCPLCEAKKEIETLRDEISELKKKVEDDV
jgi:hypothetical protein